MLTILALFATFTFLGAIPFIILDMAAMIRNQNIQDKESEDLKTALEDAKRSGSSTEIDVAQKAYNEASSKSCWGWVGACVVSTFSIIGALVIRLAELVIIIAALSLHVGNPIFGFVSLGIFFLSFIYGYYGAKRVEKEQALATKIGNIYLPKTDWGAKILWILTSSYLLYVVLVIIGVPI